MGVILALQAARPVHLGVDNANVVAHDYRWQGTGAALLAPG